MRTLTCMVVGLTFALAGCDSDMRSQLESDVKRLEAKCDGLKRENETLRLAVDNLRAEKTVMEKDLSRLRSENNSLKRQLESEKESAAAQIEQLKAQLAATRQAAPPAPASTAAGTSVPTGGSAPDAELLAESEQAVADLETKSQALQARVTVGRSKVLAVTRATIDAPMVPPPGGFIRDGQIWRREQYTPSTIPSSTPGTTQPPSPVYRETPIGPAVRQGDFRTSYERDKAIQEAKDALLPLEQELRSIRSQLDKAKAQLAKLRSQQQSVK